MKKVLFSATMAGLIISLLIAGCAGGGSVPPQQGGASAPGGAPADWQTRWNNVVAGAKQEGKIVFYGEAGPIMKDRITAIFKEKYGIQVDTVTGKGPEVAQKYASERAAGLVLGDILMVGQTTTPTIVKPKGLLTSPKPYLILPEVLDMNAWPEGKLPFLDKDEISMALIAGHNRFVAVNTELVKQPELSYQDLLDPKWKGKIILYDPSMPGNGGTWFAFMMLRAFGRDAGEKYLRQLATQDLVVTKDARLQGEATAKGKYAIAIGAMYQSVSDLAAAGAPFNWARIKEGGMILPGAFVAALPDKQAHPNGAILMINYLLSKEGQLIASEAAGLAPRRNDVDTKFVLPGVLPQPGDKFTWLDEDFILTEPTLYPLAKQIFGL